LKRIKNKFLRISLYVLAGVLAVYIVMSALGARQAFNIPRYPVLHQATEISSTYEDAAFPTRVDGLTLKGWFFPGSNSQVIMFIHGGFQNRIDENADTVGLAKALLDKGYNILLFDLRGRGESEGKGTALSYIDEDIGGAVDYLVERGFSLKNICILGFCSGASMAAVYASQNEIGSLILDGAFIDGGTMLVRQAEAAHLPGWVARFFTPGGMVMTRLLYDYHRIDTIDIIPDIKCPVFFIHEENDPFTTMEETERMLDASTNPENGFTEIPGATHSKGFIFSPQQYVEGVDRFLKKIAAE
jgi:uncharacterized protein